MTIEERLQKLRQLAGASMSGWIDGIFDNTNKYPPHWWRFDDNEIKKRNLERANEFWRELYNAYKNGKLDEVYSKSFIGDCIEIIKELEKEMKK